MRRLVRSGLLICGALVFSAGFLNRPGNRAKRCRAGRDAKIAPQSPSRRSATHAKPAHPAAKPRPSITGPRTSVSPTAARPVVRKPSSHPPPIAVAHEIARRSSGGADRAALEPAPPRIARRRRLRPDRLAAPLHHQRRRGRDARPATSSPHFLHDAFRIARSADGAPEQRRTELANLMTTRMDLSRILVYATRAAYQSASPEMQQQFRLSFASFLAEAYTPRMKLAAGLAFTTGAAAPQSGRRDHRIDDIHQARDRRVDHRLAGRARRQFVQDRRCRQRGRKPVADPALVVHLGDGE